MFDEVIDGLLETIRLDSLEQCREIREKAFQELQRKRTQGAREKISEITRQIKEIDRVIRKVIFKSKLMKLTVSQQNLIEDEIIGKFASKRQELVMEKMRLARY
ncbi:hypothetical protein P9G84_14900 [Brevibacillus centrosporus]|uniref:hypothetical protein n=1 Tax=Brevibacillus centrosporus TaxID=54910 RepID=UPI000F0A2D8A|nr:hypothetical protein [Brevibacillus centrosporus]MEC2130235.1 hypothetical protein [Brevibacillus centrosporus]RNB70951.1 hypothetical protein EDM55_09205 [Brevibacillus centrosporus]GED30265.1 hypothetical protein BCE02nite_14060 [Brevibacillus centrosporus]